MIKRKTVDDLYFEWMYDIVCDGRFADDISFRKLLMRLHTIPFRYIIRGDQNRAEDGLDLRYRFDRKNHDQITGPCSVLEMMLALAIRCEETIMDNTVYGNRTGQWFWSMITNLGLGSMEDRKFDRDYVDNVVKTFLERRYEPNGKGGLFTVNGNDDLRKVEIWYQMCWHLNDIS